MDKFFYGNVQFVQSSDVSAWGGLGVLSLRDFFKDKS